MARRRHPNKHIEEALRYAEEHGWRVVLGGAHAWGHLYCPHAQRGGCQHPIWSTHQVSENHARRIRSVVDNCPHE